MQSSLSHIFPTQFFGSLEYSVHLLYYADASDYYFNGMQTELQCFNMMGFNILLLHYQQRVALVQSHHYIVISSSRLFSTSSSVSLRTRSHAVTLIRCSCRHYSCHRTCYSGVSSLTRIIGEWYYSSDIYIF